MFIRWSFCKLLPQACGQVPSKPQAVPRPPLAEKLGRVKEVVWGVGGASGFLRCICAKNSVRTRA